VSLPAEHGVATPAFTSGSTGRPVMILSTGVTKAFWNAITLRDHLWHQRDFHGKLAVIRSLGDSSSGETSLTRRSAQWGTATSELVQTGPCAMLSIHATIDQQAEWLLQQDPDYLLTYPSNVAALARRFQATGARLSRLREVRTFGEILEPHVPAICQAVWGAKVVDIYSSQEIGYLALQCPQQSHYHVQAENVLVEVLDDENQPCQPGQVGRLIVTTLHNFAMPLIRYEIGDYAEPGLACPCGRSLPVLKHIVGRQRNMALLPDGRRFWPSVELAGSEDLQSLPPIQQFQLVQRTLSEMELLLVTPRGLTAAEESTIRSWVERATLGAFRISLRYVATIARSPTGKFEDFRNELADLHSDSQDAAAERAS
jgi:phenylacetate-CoA ligase